MGATSSLQRFGVSVRATEARKQRRAFLHYEGYAITLQICTTTKGQLYRLYADFESIKVALKLGFKSNNTTSAWTSDPKVAVKYIKFADDKTAAHIIQNLLTSN